MILHERIIEGEKSLHRNGRRRTFAGGFLRVRKIKVPEGRVEILPVDEGVDGAPSRIRRLEDGHRTAEHGGVEIADHVEHAITHLFQLEALLFELPEKSVLRIDEHIFG